MLIRGNRGTYSVRNLRTGPKRSEWKRKSEGRNSVRRTGSSGGSSWRSWRSDSSLEGMSMASLAAFTRLVSFSREVAAMHIVFPTMTERETRQFGRICMGMESKRGSVLLCFVQGLVWGGRRGRRRIDSFEIGVAQSKRCCPKVINFLNIYFFK